MPPSFKRIFKKKTVEMQRAILECIEQMAGDLRHPGLQVHKVQGSPGVWEAYVDGGNRVTFTKPSPGVIEMLNNCNHDILRRY